MDSRSAKHHFRALRLAHACATFGARLVTVQRLTHLPSRDLRRWFFPHSQDAPRGRAPCSTEWYPRANALNRVEASIFVALFADLLVRGFDTVEALIGAYEHYCCHGQAQPRISFDRAFDLASQVAGKWLADTPGLALARCAQCGCQSLVGYGGSTPVSCPFCVLLERYWLDPRIRCCFPVAAHVSPRTVQLAITWLLPELQSLSDGGARRATTRNTP